MILIVDDRQENIFSLRSVLEQHGFETDTALSGEEALKKLLKNEYALIILDVQMPDMDGFEVAEAITGLNKTRDIPIIFLSAVNTHKRFIAKGFESGAVEYLTKPVDTDILILKVRNFYKLYEKTHALRKTEKALTSTVNELYSTLESLPQLAFTTGRNGEIEYVNKLWFEYSDSAREFPKVKEGQALEEFWLKSIQSGTPVELEVAIMKMQDRQYYHHLMRAVPVMVNGFITRWVGSFTSIHDQKLLNEILERKVAERTRELLEINRELEISNNDLQQFTFVASHDLKEPLRKIQFFGNMLKDKAELNGEVAVFLDKIITSSGRMNNLINDLLTFASLSGPELFEPTDMNELVAGILTDLELSIAEKNASVTVGDLPALEVIPSLMRQLFQNLLSNALKFSRPGISPRIAIRAYRTDIPDINGKPSANGRFCLISISDNGIGFEEKYREKIFTIFQRLNARAEYEGTGIGLAIAKKITDRHNGMIGARSTPGEETTFYVLLPVMKDRAVRIDEPDQMAMKPSN